LQVTKVVQAARDSVLSLQCAHRAEAHRARVVGLALSAVPAGPMMVSAMRLRDLLTMPP
jgi:hypothetical protein